MGESDEGGVSSLADELRSLAVIMVKAGPELYDVEEPADELSLEPVETVDPPAVFTANVLTDDDDEISQGGALTVFTMLGSITIILVSLGT